MATPLGPRNPTGPVGATVALLVTASVLLSAFAGWVIAGTASPAVGIAVALCAALLLGGTALLVRFNILSVTVRLPSWLQRIEETAPVDLPWSDAVQRVVNLGSEEAAHFRQPRIGPEHLLLGLMREDGHAARAMQSLDVTLERLIRSVDFLSGMGNANPENRPALDPTARRALDASSVLARAAHARMIGTDHLLLALTNEEHGTVTAILDSLGCTSASLTRALRETK